ncbi:uncharacterized protein K02A2.6-like [Ornithodoros turicata]|uniref:uncharacterized protein K02A2.6-like n=1 Tax=Ornithodoros turicata TaxID=34597 RepID=UPI00313A45CB
MACSAGIPPPPPFLPTLGAPAVPWPQWKQVFVNYLEAVGGDAFPAKRRKAILLNSLGVEGQRIFYGFPPDASPPPLPTVLGSDDAKRADSALDDYEVALRALDKHFIATTNELVERHRFRSRWQLPGEPFQDFVTSLLEPASSCSYGTATDDAIRDQIVEGTTSRKLRERLLYEGTSLTLGRAIEIGIHQEVTKRELEIFDSKEVQRVSTWSKHRDYKQPDGKNKPRAICYRCGSTSHLANNEKCPARQQRCRKCHKLGHFQVMCQSRKNADDKNVRYCHGEDTTKNDYEILKVNKDRLSNGGIYVNVIISGTTLNFLVDTGSTVSLIPENVYKEALSQKFPLSPANVNLLDYSRQQIGVKGCFLAPVEYHGHNTSVLFYVVQRGTALLGLGAIRNLGLHIQGATMTCYDTFSATSLPPKLQEEFAGVFTGTLGHVKGYKHQVKLKKSVKPVAAKLRRLPLALREEVSQELRRLEKEDIVERVSASEWISPIVVVRKRDNSLRLSGDLREPNKAIVVDAFPLPHMEELLHQLSGATWFSKLDLASAYHQLELTPDSREITTFITQDGLFRFK